MLDDELHKKWSFSGKDIFATITEKKPFTLCKDRIQLYDFNDTYYEIDLEGRLLK